MTVNTCEQTFQNRLVEVIDQAQHFAALGPAGGGGQSGDAALTFREGLEVTEREREFSICLFLFPQTLKVAPGESISARAGERKED